MSHSQDTLLTDAYTNRSDFLRALATHPDNNAMKECRLFEAEIFWRDHFHWLKEQGYLLRPRYHPDWVASWKDSEKGWRDVEDGQVARVSDSTRVSI